MSENTPEAIAFGHEPNVSLTATTDQLLLAAHEVQIQAKGNTPAVTIVAYTGGVMDVPGWGPLVIDLAGIDLSAPQISILADHDATLRIIVSLLSCTSDR